jgi:phosphoesterase RecJ-like protein
MLALAEQESIRDWLAACQRPLIISHRRPDGDALGAIAALSLALQARGQDPRPTLYEPLPAGYAMLADSVAWCDWSRVAGELRRDADAVVILDTCSWSQLEPIADYLRAAPRTLVIDHHATGDDIARRADDLYVTDPTAGAVCLLLTEWLQNVRVPITREIATALFVGITTDTGWFRFGNTDARLLRAAAHLVDCGAPLNGLYRAIYEQQPAAKLRLIGHLLTRLELHADGRLAVMKLRQADFDAAGADRTMTDDLINEAGRIAGIEAMVLFTEEPDGAVRVNFRSKRHLDVAALAQQFNGGGHVRAAGARPPGTWDEVVPRIIAATVAALAPADD